jgi:fucose permease
MNTKKKSMFVTNDGQNVFFTFLIVSSLFLLWGFCNGMIDVMDKHFQEELHLTLSQSAWVQFAHYLGYFLMALPAGWLATKLGYKGGIIAGLLMVAVGGLWFIPATHIAQFWAFLLGVCFIAAGLTFLETIANPYTTVLGHPHYAATRINLAQSCNGIGWIFGPIAGGVFFYGQDAAGNSTGSQTIWIPYAGVAVVVIILAIIFYFANVPDIKTEDDYHLDESTPNVSHSIWKHPHFVFAVLAQFLYVAAQCGIFSFFINYMTSQVPAIPNAWNQGVTANWIEVKTTLATSDIKDFTALASKLKQKPDDVSAFLSSQLSDETRKELEASKDIAGVPHSLQVALVQDLNLILKQDPRKAGKPGCKGLFYDSRRFSGINLDEKARQNIAALENILKNKDIAPVAQAKVGFWQRVKEIVLGKKEKFSIATLNRELLQAAYPAELPFDDSSLCISDRGASFLASLGFVCFLLGRFSGAGILKKVEAHKVLGLYGLLNVIICGLVFMKLGWFSVACVFLSYFFMSIMFPTIFALGIFGLGARAKKASAFIVMAIMGGAIVPKLMGYVGDHYGMSRAFIVPMVCFVYVAFYGFRWPKFSGFSGMVSIKSSGH